MDGALNYVSELSIELAKHNINVTFQIYENSLKCMLKFHGLHDLIDHDLNLLNAMHNHQRKQQAFIDASTASKDFFENIG